MEPEHKQLQSSRLVQYFTMVDQLADSVISLPTLLSEGDKAKQARSLQSDRAFLFELECRLLDFSQATCISGSTVLKQDSKSSGKPVVVVVDLQQAAEGFAGGIDNW